MDERKDRPAAQKSTVDQIRRRFDAEVERFSNLETGQSATIDAPLVLELVTQAAAAATPHARRILDIGCGAGNYTLKMLQSLPGLEVDLIDLSQPMLDRAVERIRGASAARVQAHPGDVREIDLGSGAFDIILAAAVFHHLRTEDEWRSVFSKCHRALRDGGSIWISDLVEHELPPVQRRMWERYGEYLRGLKGEDYRRAVLAYVEQEDTPRTLIFQLDLLRTVGFRKVEVLHKHGCFAAFGAVR